MAIETYVLGGGCFWCLDAVYRDVKGVIDVISGYAGGETPHPTYEQVCAGMTGHAEVVAVSFDDEIVPADVILDIFFTLHDPTQLNRQGNDIGTQYRSIMLYRNAEQRQKFQEALARAQTWWPQPIVTRVEPITEFFEAEQYHQNFFAKNPNQGYCLAVSVPKVNKVRAAFAKFVR